jgi:hypothetical protein
VDHEKGGPEPQLGAAGVEERVQVFADEMPDERIGQDPFQPRSDLDPYFPSESVVEDQHAARTGPATDPEVAHRGQRELLRRRASAVGGKHDPNVDTGLSLHSVQVSVVRALVDRGHEADPIVHMPPSPADRRPEQHENHDVQGKHHQQNDASKLHG